MSASSAFRRVAVLLGVVVVAVACQDPTGSTSRSPLDGLAYAVGEDSLGNTPPSPPAGPMEPGYVRGTVLGPWDGSGSSSDTLASSPRIAGVVVALYELPAGGTWMSGAPDKLGEIVASTVTGADGKFTLPTVAGGSYVVTFTPPAASAYGGVWVLATVHATSHEFPWWVVLWKK